MCNTSFHYRSAVGWKRPMAARPVCPLLTHYPHCIIGGIHCKCNQGIRQRVCQQSCVRQCILSSLETSVDHITSFLTPFQHRASFKGHMTWTAWGGNNCNCAKKLLKCLCRVGTGKPYDHIHLGSDRNCSHMVPKGGDGRLAKLKIGSNLLYARLNLLFNQAYKSS